MKLAVGYVRTSSNGNPDSSIPNQIHSITKFCKENNMMLKTILVDEKKTGTKVDGREQYKQLNSFIRNKAIDVVIVTYSDRLARESLEFVRVLQDMNKNGIEFISISEHIRGSKLSAHEIVWMAIQNEMENNNRKKRLIESKNICLTQGKFICKPPLGYKHDLNKRLIIDKETEESVKKIFTMYLNNFSISQIIKNLNAKGIKNPNGMWRDRGVRLLLRKKIYTGNIYDTNDKEKLSEVKHPAYITMDQHEEIIKKLEKNKCDRPLYKIHLASCGVLICEKMQNKYGRS